MIIIGHPLLESAEFVCVERVEEIERVEARCVVFFESRELEASLALAKHCHAHGVTYAVVVQELEAFLLHASLSPAYLIVPKLAQAQAFQKIAEQYLLDSKLLCVIKSSKQMAKVAESGIDGVIFKQVLGSIRALI